MIPALIAISACSPAAEQGKATPAPDYQGASVALLDSDLLQVNVSMKGARGEADVKAYADCVAAKLVLDQNFGFARHVRTNFDKQGGVWTADAVYDIASSLPPGISPIDVETTVSACADNNIPTV